MLLDTTRETRCYKELDTDAASSAAVTSVSCDGHCVVEYRESRSPVGLGISRYGDPPNNADLMDWRYGSAHL